MDTSSFSPLAHIDWDWVSPSEFWKPPDLAKPTRSGSFHFWNVLATHRHEHVWGGAPDAFLTEHLGDVLIPGASSVLDVAAGDGRNSCPFLGQGLNVMAVDLSPVALTTFAVRCWEAGSRKPTLVASDLGRWRVPLHARPICSARAVA